MGFCQSRSQRSWGDRYITAPQISDGLPIKAAGPASASAHTDCHLCGQVEGPLYPHSTCWECGLPVCQFHSTKCAASDCIRSTCTKVLCRTHFPLRAPKGTKTSKRAWVCCSCSQSTDLAPSTEHRIYCSVVGGAPKRSYVEWFEDRWYEMYTNYGGTEYEEAYEHIAYNGPLPEWTFFFRDTDRGRFFFYLLHED